MKKVKKAEIATFLTLGLVVVGAVLSLLSGVMVNRQKNIASNPRAQTIITEQCPSGERCFLLGQIVPTNYIQTGSECLGILNNNKEVGGYCYKLRTFPTRTPTPKKQNNSSSSSTGACGIDQKCGSGNYWECTKENGCDLQSCTEQNLEFRCCVADSYDSTNQTYRIRDYGCKGQPCQNFKINNQIGYLVGCAGFDLSYFDDKGESRQKLVDFNDSRRVTGKYVEWSSTFPDPKLTDICSCAHSCIGGVKGGCWWGGGPYQCNSECCSKGICPTPALNRTIAARLTATAAVALSTTSTSTTGQQTGTTTTPAAPGGGTGRVLTPNLSSYNKNKKCKVERIYVHNIEVEKNADLGKEVYCDHIFLKKENDITIFRECPKFLEFQCQYSCFDSNNKQINCLGAPDNLFDQIETKRITFINNTGTDINDFNVIAQTNKAYTLIKNQTLINKNYITVIRPAICPVWSKIIFLIGIDGNNITKTYNCSDLIHGLIINLD